MKVKIVENGVEKLVEASYIIVDGVTLEQLVARVVALEQDVNRFVEDHNKREKAFQKLVKEKL